jgi:hypothetical protein
VQKNISTNKISIQKTISAEESRRLNFCVEILSLRAMMPSKISPIKPIVIKLIMRAAVCGTGHIARHRQSNPKTRRE